MICEKHNEEKVLQGRKYKCKTCNKEYQAKWYKDNRRKHMDRVNHVRNRNKERTRDFIYEHLSKNPCNICGESDILVLEFDHMRDKKFNISEAIADNFSIETLKKEIDKCQVLCANCHRRKTAIEQNHYRYKKQLVGQ
jgi:5-methylcytosine-specific restriction endonuclease McrA